MRHQHRLGTPQMRIGGHGGIARLLGPRHQRIQPLRQLQPQIIDTGSHIKAQISGNLLVAAAATVQLVTHVANHHDQLFLDKMMHVLGLIIIEERWGHRSLFSNLIEALQDGNQFI